MKDVDIGTWEISNERLIIYETDGNNLLSAYDYSFSDNDNTLMLTDTDSGDSTVYTRK